MIIMLKAVTVKVLGLLKKRWIQIAEGIGRWQSAGILLGCYSTHTILPRAIPYSTNPITIASSLLDTLDEFIAMEAAVDFVIGRLQPST